MDNIVNVRRCKDCEYHSPGWCTLIIRKVEDNHYCGWAKEKITREAIMEELYARREAI